MTLEKLAAAVMWHNPNPWWQAKPVSRAHAAWTVWTMRGTWRQTHFAEWYALCCRSVGKSNAPRPAFQDGAQFYDSRTGNLLAEYPALVRGDYDMPGAEAARVLFLAHHPQFRME